MPGEALYVYDIQALTASATSVHIYPIKRTGLAKKRILDGYRHSRTGFVLGLFVFFEYDGLNLHHVLINVDS
ncbi:hypothetical protein M419DRAFT_120225 [Trichoderma reesei RUT C-30]|jgi:hypothetical protein|uniref:Uncharacterized protein n=1 Tax=Hypocrea jecorina (strain ATCC 56765 / BCRC 32924 / NRRL 11460 / Rut C-30) TaxID=1344414 RepID=A0A024S3J8_HYPJR|nr:hypothetical protein M419DRAFT_120225 [Trichoderma reesei RUT C-30]